MDTQLIGNIASILGKRDIISQDSRFSIATRGRSMTQVLENVIKNGAFEEDLELPSEEINCCAQNGLVQVVDIGQLVGEEGKLMDLRKKYYKLYDDVNSERASMWQSLPSCVRSWIIPDLSERILSYFWKKFLVKNGKNIEV